MYSNSIDCNVQPDSSIKRVALRTLDNQYNGSFQFYWNEHAKVRRRALTYRTAALINHDRIVLGTLKRRGFLNLTVANCAHVAIEVGGHDMGLDYQNYVVDHIIRSIKHYLHEGPHPGTMRAHKICPKCERPVDKEIIEFVEAAKELVEVYIKAYRTCPLPMPHFVNHTLEELQTLIKLYSER